MTRPFRLALLSLVAPLALALGSLAPAPSARARSTPPATPAKPGKKPTPARKPDAALGKKRFVTEGCKGCHTTRDIAGGLQGPDLSDAGTWTATRIRSYIVKPKRGSIMPAYKGPKEVVEDLVAYLGRQKPPKR